MLLRNPRSRFTSGALAFGLALVLAACSGSSNKAAPPTSTTARPQVLAVKTSVLKVGTVDVESAGPSVQIDPATGRAVLGLAQAYINDALFAPLKTGRIGAGYSALFDSGVKASAVGVDEPALTDIGVGKVTTLVTKASPVELSALAGTLGQLMYVATNFDLAITTTTAGGTLSINHNVELTFAQTGKAWLVTAYRVVTARKSVAGTTTTTATGGTAP